MCGSKDSKRKVVKANAIKHINWKEKLISSMTLDSRKECIKIKLDTQQTIFRNTHTLNNNNAQQLGDKLVI